jgi:hypothetical protein
MSSAWSVCELAVPVKGSRKGAFGSCFGTISTTLHCIVFQNEASLGAHSYQSPPCGLREPKVEERCRPGNSPDPF